MLFRNNSVLFWTLCFFLGTSSGTCSSSLSRFTTTSGCGDQPSLVMVHKYLSSGSSSRTDDPRVTAEDAKGAGYTSSAGSDSRSLGSMDWCVWMTDSCVIGERSEATGSVDLRATAIVLSGSTKNPSESLGNTYEDSLSSLWSRERNLVAGDGASTTSSSGTGSGVPTGASSKPLWIVGSRLPPATAVAT